MPGRSHATGKRRVTPRARPLLDPEITYIDYKDTDLLRKFISDRGKIRSRRVTRVTKQQQRQLAQAIKTAREMALLADTWTYSHKKPGRHRYRHKHGS